MNDVARRLMISISTSIILISAISIIPQLVQESWINPVDGVLIALPLSLLIVYIAMKFGRQKGPENKTWYISNCFQFFLHLSWVYSISIFSPWI